MSVFDMIFLSAIVAVFCAFALVLAYAQRQTEDVTATKRRAAGKPPRTTPAAPANSRIAA